MVKICAALNCLNNSVIGNDLTWFPLPKNEVSRERWIKLLGIKVKDAVNPGTRVCCDHFCTKDFLNNSKKFLKAVAIPSLNLVQLIHCAPKVIKVKNHDINSYSNVEILDVQPKTIESKPPAPLLLKQRPNAKPPLVEARPSRRAAQAAAEKIQKTVETYGVFEGNEDDEMYVDEPGERDPSPPPVKQFSESANRCCCAPKRLVHNESTLPKFELLTKVQNNINSDVEVLDNEVQGLKTQPEKIESKPPAQLLLKPIPKPLSIEAGPYKHALDAARAATKDYNSYIYVPYTTDKDIPEVSCREVLELQGLQNCLECSFEITKDHFAKQLKCKNCEYCTCCTIVMLKHHKQFHVKKPKFPKRTLFLKQRMMCSCGFNSFNGERLASHLVSCHSHVVSIVKTSACMTCQCVSHTCMYQRARGKFQQVVSKRVKKHKKKNVSTEKSESLTVPVLESSNSALRNNGVNLEMLSLTLGRAKKHLINQTSSMENASSLEVKDPIEEHSIAALQNETVNFEAISPTLENALAQNFHQEVKSEAVSIEKTTSFGLKRLLRENLSSTLENKSGKLGTIVKDKIVPHLQQKETSEKTTGHIKNEVLFLDKTPSLGIECLVKENSSLDDENFHSLQ